MISSFDFHIEFFLWGLRIACSFDCLVEGSCQSGRLPFFISDLNIICVRVFPDVSNYCL